MGNYSSTIQNESHIILPTLAVMWIGAIIVLAIGYLANISLGAIGTFLWIFVIVIAIIAILRILFG